ncbi:MAG: 3-isopropylmalate dehydratase small subunit, partial [Pseudomonadota bacterium]
DDDTHNWLLSNHGAQITIDLDQCQVKHQDEVLTTFSVDAFARHCLMQGVDELGYLLSQSDAIAEFEANR